MSHRTDVVATIRRAAKFVRPGGSVVFQEWHFETLRWAEEPPLPNLPVYRRYAQWALDALRGDGIHVNLGFGLSNAFVQAGRPMPAVHAELRPVDGHGDPGYRFFQDLLQSLAPSIERQAIATGRDSDVATIAERLECEFRNAGGHAFLPLQVGAWTRLS